MANEIEKTIEDLEAEVIAELEEANGADAPKKGAAPAQAADHIYEPKPGQGKKAQDTGKPVVDPEQKDSPAKKVAATAKEVSGDAQQKGSKK